MIDTKNTFSSFSVILHDLRSPINTVIGLTELAKQSLNNQIELENYLIKINNISHYMLTLTNSFLDYCKNEKVRNNIKDFYLDDIINEMNTIFEIQASFKDIKFLIGRENIKNYHLNGDGLKLKQIISNLLSNAIKFTPSGGKVDFIINNIEKNNKVKIKFVIRDNGIGINQSYLQDIYKPFTQEDLSIKQKYGGAGLGMMIVKKLLNSIGGKIEVSSIKGQGTTFTVITEYEKIESEYKFDYNFAGKRILVVDDSELNVDIIKDLLKETEADIDTAYNGNEAIDKFTKNKENYYDLILMDLRMPFLDGCSSTKMIRKLPRADAKTIKIIAISSNCLDDDVSAAIKCGMNDYIMKPISSKLLFSTIKKYL